MGDIEVIQTACPTSGGTTTQDITFSGFGTPKGALFIVSKGTANGTAVNHAMISLGFTDGTRSRCLVTSDEDAQAAADGYRSGNRTNVVTTLLETTGAIDGVAVFDSWITDGVRINWTDYPPSAYKLTVVLFGGTGVSNVYVNDYANPGGLNVEQDITAPNFQPDLVFMLTQGGSSFGGAINNSSIFTFGFAIRDGASPPTQRYVGWSSTDAANPTIVGNTIDTAGSGGAVASGTGQDVEEINNFDAQGFSVFTRVSNAAGGVDFAYMAIKLNGLTPKVLTYDTKAGTTGSHAITGAGITPQFGLILATSSAAIVSNSTGPDCESIGIGCFTVNGKGASSIAIDDAVTPSNAESVSDNVAINLRNSASTMMVADFTSFNADGATLNYTTVDGTARKAAVLFISASSSSSPGSASESLAPHLTDTVQPVTVSISTMEAP